MMNSIYYIWRADCLNRMLNKRYLITLLFMSVLTFIFFPNIEASYGTMIIHGYRGIYNSAWLGASLAVLNTFFLPIICFYLIKNTISEDINNGVSELIAPTPVTKFNYLFGKWLSNLSILLGIMLIMTCSAMFIQLWHGDDHAINLGHLFLPQLVYVLPILAAISAAALLFETIPLLRGGIGNIAYFFLWIGLIVRSLESGSGVSEIVEQIRQAVMIHDPLSEGGVGIGINIWDEQHSKLKSTFVWSGIVYNFVMFSAFLKVMILSLVLFVAALFSFDRFEKSRSSQDTKRSTGKLMLKINALFSPLAHFFIIVCEPWSFMRLMRQEILLLVKGLSPWWYLAITILLLAQLFAPLEVVRSVILPASWILCVLIFSPLGQREKQEKVEGLIFSCLSPIKKQFPAMLLAGFLVAMGVVSMALFRFILSSEVYSVFMLFAGALFIPSMALACGTLTGTTRTFEILFTTLWYIGPLQGGGLDFIGVDINTSQQNDAALLFILVALVLIVLALQARKWQIQRG